MTEAPKIKRTDQKKADIIAAAIEEFRTTGFAGARINRIAERAGVSKRTLYKHYDSKESLFQAIIDQVIAEHATITEIAYCNDRPISDQLYNCMDQYFEVIGQDNYMTLSRIVVSEFLRDQEMSRGMMEKSKIHNQNMVALIEAAINDAQLRKADPEKAATQLISLGKAFLFWPKFLTGETLPDAEAREAILKDAVAMFLNHYGIDKA